MNIHHLPGAKVGIPRCSCVMCARARHGLVPGREGLLYTGVRLVEVRPGYWEEPEP